MGQQALANTLAAVVASQIKAGGGETPNVPALNNLVNAALGGLADVPPIIPLIGVGLAAVGNLPLITVGGTAVALGVCAWSVYHLIQWAWATEKIQDDFKQFVEDQEKECIQWENENGMSFEEGVEYEWGDCLERQHYFYLQRKAEIEIDMAEYLGIEGSREPPTGLPTAPPVQAIADDTPQDVDETPQQEKEEQSELEQAGGEDDDEPELKPTNLPNYIAPALMIAAGIEAVNRLFKQMLVPLAAIAIFRHELIKLITAAFSAKIIKDKK